MTPRSINGVNVNLSHSSKDLLVLLFKFSQGPKCKHKSRSSPNVHPSMECLYKIIDGPHNWQNSSLLAQPCLFLQYYYNFRKGLKWCKIFRVFFWIHKRVGHYQTSFDLRRTASRCIRLLRATWTLLSC